MAERLRSDLETIAKAGRQESIAPVKQAVEKPLHPNTSVKLSVNLSTEQIDVLKDLAEKRGITMTEVLRHAIDLEKFFMDKQQEGSKFIISRRHLRFFRKDHLLLFNY